MEKGIKRLLFMIFLLTSFFFTFSASFGQNADKTKKKKGQIMDFTGDTIQGDLTKPDGEYFEVRKQMKHESLLSLRKHWKKRLVLSVNQL